jgi:CBS-domain-containing membrane protein
MPTKTYIPIQTIPLKADVSYFQPPALPAIAHWDDPAMQVLVDFKYVKAETIGADETIDTALTMVKNCSYHALLVIDKEDKILGLISSEDLLGEKPLKAIQERRIARADISVRMVMTPQHELMAIDVENLRHAKVGHIVSTLHARKQHYALAVKVDEVNDKQTVRGLFSLAQISKQLGVDVVSDVPEAHSIAELHHDVHLND